MRPLVRFIDDNYSGKAVEVGVGSYAAAARSLADRGFEVVVTDVRDVTVGGVEFVRDDVTEPRIGVYEGASVVYSVRPPYELHASLERVARAVGADLVIVPLGNEGSPLDYELVNRDGKAFYVVES